MRKAMPQSIPATVKRARGATFVLNMATRCCFLLSAWDRGVFPGAPPPSGVPRRALLGLPGLDELDTRRASDGFLAGEMALVEALAVFGASVIGLLPSERAALRKERDVEAAGEAPGAREALRNERRPEDGGEPPYFLPELKLSFSTVLMLSLSLKLILSALLPPPL